MVSLLVLCALPLVMTVGASMFKSTEASGLTMAASLVLGAVMIALVSLILFFRTPAVMELLETVETSSGQVTAYRTNGGATTAYGIQVRNERLLVPGISVVRDIGSAYPAYGVELELVAEGRLRVVYLHYGDSRRSELIAIDSDWP